MMSYLEYTERAVRGIVKDKDGNPVKDAQEGRTVSFVFATLIWT